MLKNLIKKIIPLPIKRLMLSTAGIFFYCRDLLQFNKWRHPKFSISLKPVFRDRFLQAGVRGAHYFYQDLHVAQRIAKLNPEKIIDIGSRIDGFCAHVASFREIEIADIRPLQSKITNINFIQLDITGDINKYENYADCVSCLHVIEHIGLGRYKDPLSSNGFEIAIQNLIKLCKPGGKLFISTPIGTQRIEFNKQRVFELPILLEQFSELELEQFSYVDDSNTFHSDVALSENDIETTLGLAYGLGIFELRKKL